MFGIHKLVPTDFLASSMLCFENLSSVSISKSLPTMLNNLSKSVNISNFFCWAQLTCIYNNNYSNHSNTGRPKTEHLTFQTLFCQVTKWLNYSKTGQKCPARICNQLLHCYRRRESRESDIKNWRQITLSNCDAKLITKALASRMIKVIDLESLMKESQSKFIMLL